MSFKSTKKILLLSSCLAVSTQLFAEVEGTVHLGKEAIDKNQVIELLSPKLDINSKPLTRGIRLHQPDDSIQTESAARAISLEVYFDFDSAALTEDAKMQLHPVGEALQSNELASVSFTLEGHTDAAGDSNYNLSLSEQRAASVKSYFVNAFQIPAERVDTVGKGESELLDDNNPGGGVNRRVTIIAD